MLNAPRARKTQGESAAGAQRSSRGRLASRLGHMFCFSLKYFLLVLSLGAQETGGKSACPRPHGQHDDTNIYTRQPQPQPLAQQTLTTKNACYIEHNPNHGLHSVLERVARYHTAKTSDSAITTCITTNQYVPMTSRETFKHRKTCDNYVCHAIYSYSRQQYSTNYIAHGRGKVTKEPPSRARHLHNVTPQGPRGLAGY